MTYAHDYLIFVSGIVCGIILFQSVIVAPSVFSVFEVKDAGLFLRKVFPKFFQLLMAFSLAMLILVALADSSDKTGFVLPAINLVFSGISYLAVPATNRARDDGEEKKFKALHSLTVVLTLLMLILNFAWWCF